MLHGDFHFGPNIRFFGQLVSGFENGRIGGPSPGHRRRRLRRPPSVPRSGPALWRGGYADLAARSAGDVLRLGAAHRRAGGRSTCVARSTRRDSCSGSATGRWTGSGPSRSSTVPACSTIIPYPNLALGRLCGPPLGPVAGRPCRSLLPRLREHTGDLRQGDPRAEHADELRNSLGTRLWGQPMPWEYNVEDTLAVRPVRARRHRGVGGRLGDSVQLRQAAASPPRRRWWPTSPAATATRARRTFRRSIPCSPPGPTSTSRTRSARELHPAASVRDVRFGEKVTLLADWAFFWRESLEDGIYGPFAGPPIRTGQTEPEAVTSAARPRSR